MVLKGFRMRTIPKGTNRCITVMAQDTEAHREVMPFKPSIEFCPAINLDKPSMLYPTTSDMVNTKEFCVGFAATSTFTLIMSKDLLFNFFLASAVF